MTRQRLPNRRDAELRDFIHDNRRWTVTVGRNAAGEVREIFIDAPKASPVAELARDAALIASIGLQSGVALEVLRHALRDRNTGPLAVALSLVDDNGQRAAP